MSFVDILFGLAALACFAGAFFITSNPASKMHERHPMREWAREEDKKSKSPEEEKVFSTVHDETN